MELDITECLAIARTRLAELDDLESPTPDEIDEIEALESLAAHLQEIARKLDQAAAWPAMSTTTGRHGPPSAAPKGQSDEKERPGVDRALRSKGIGKKTYDAANSAVGREWQAPAGALAALCATGTARRWHPVWPRLWLPPWHQTGGGRA